MAAARARALAAANDDGNNPIAEIVRDSPAMNPPRSLTSTIAEQQQQQVTITLDQLQQQGSNWARASPLLKSFATVQTSNPLLTLLW